MSAQEPAPADVTHLDEYRARKRAIRVLEDRARELNVDFGCASTAEMLNDFERSLRAFAAAASARFTKVEVVTQSLDELVAALAQEGEAAPIERDGRARAIGRGPRIVVDNTTSPEF